ncbi:hypothetical protein ScPMuIL_003153 [Solemya velum]
MLGKKSSAYGKHSNSRPGSFFFPFHNRCHFLSSFLRENGEGPKLGEWAVPGFSYVLLHVISKWLPRTYGHSYQDLKHECNSYQGFMCDNVCGDDRLCSFTKHVQTKIPDMFALRKAGEVL